MSKVSVYVIAYNEQEKLREALASVSWADEIVLCDSGSTDATADIARSFGARVIQVPFEGFGRLRNSALDACTHEWIFSLDADERCTPAVRDEIRATINGPQPADAYQVPRRNYFMGRWIRHSGWYPDYRQPQLFRRGALRYKEDPVHEGYVLTGRLGRLTHAIWQFPFKDLSQVIAKSNRYSSLGAGRMAARQVPSSMARAFWHGLWAFLRHYILRAGVLDGWAGFVIALSTAEGTFYRYAKRCAEQRGWDRPPAAGPDGGPLGS
ncbi:MAG TPA: glycosyltransferase family 2 protein [Acidiferrobacteraceae bacterium]|nr:glycosyltransferase family 2 protein [Acidiferrobacteraceae bacterium]